MTHPGVGWEGPGTQPHAMPTVNQAACFLKVTKSETDFLAGVPSGEMTAKCQNEGLSELMQHENHNAANGF